MKLCFKLLMLWKITEIVNPSIFPVNWQTTQPNKLSH